MLPDRLPPHLLFWGAPLASPRALLRPLNPVSTQLRVGAETQNRSEGKPTSTLHTDQPWAKEAHRPEAQPRENHATHVCQWLAMSTSWRQGLGLLFLPDVRHASRSDLPEASRRQEGPGPGVAVLRARPHLECGVWQVC